MKKIALCLAGQPRGLDTAIEYQNKNLIQRNDISVDVFFHTWDYSNKIDGMNRKIVELYSPVSYTIEPPLSKSVTERYNDGHTSTIPYPFYVYSCYCHYHSMYMSNQLRVRYEQARGFKYDWVVCTRFDVALNVHLDFHSLDSSKIYEADFDPSVYQTNGYKTQNPMFAVGNGENIEKYCSMLNHLDSLISTAKSIDGHAIFGHNIRLHGLDQCMMPLNMNHPFNPDKYGSSRHSFVRNDMDIFRRFTAES